MKTFLALAVALCFYALTDIHIWQRIFETDQLWQYAGVYHKGWFFSLYGLIALGVLLLNGFGNKLFYGCTLYLLAFNGTNDVLYYWLDNRELPARLEWLDGHSLIFFKPVTDISLLASCALWLFLVFSFYFAIMYFDRLATTWANNYLRVLRNV